MALFQTNGGRTFDHRQSSRQRQSGFPSTMDQVGLTLNDSQHSLQVDFGQTDGYSNVTEVSTAKWKSSLSIDYSLEMMTVVSVLLFVVIVITAVGNAMVGLALFRYRQLRTVSNYLIGNLALSDFLLAMTIFPLSTVRQSLGYWPFGRTLCHVWLMLDVLCCTASIWNLCVIAFDRFTATVYPVWYLGLRSAPGRQAAIYAVVVWAVAATVCVPPLLGWDAGELYIFKAEYGVHQCMLFDLRSYVIYSACGSFFIPFVLTLFLYLAILIVLRGRMHKMRASKAVLGAGNKTDGGSTMPANPMKSDVEVTSFAISTIKTELPSNFEDSCSSIFDAIADELKKTETFGTITIGNTLVRLKLVDEENTQSEACALKLLNGDHQSGEKSSPNYLTISASSSNCTTGTLIVPSGTTQTTATTAAPMLLSETENDSSLLTRPSLGLLSSNSFCLSPFVRRKNQGPVENGGAGVNGGGGEALEAAPDHNSAEARLRHQQRQQRASYERREMRATIRMAIIIAFFCGFWLGFFVFYLVRGCCPDCQIPSFIDAFFFWLGYSNSSVNPILYTIFNDEFRSAFQKILGIGSGGDKKKKKEQMRTK